MKADVRHEAVAFLERLRPGGPWVLTAIVPDRGSTTVTASTAAEVCEFVRVHDGKRNLYYSVNPTRVAAKKKAAKADIARIEYLLADLDPNEDETPDAAKARYLDQLKGAFQPKPTAIVDSGNGVQALWRLSEPIELAEPVSHATGRVEFSADAQATIQDVEGRAQALMLQLGSKAGTQNIDRILRLPGTTNLPNAKKRREGRVECPTRLLAFTDASYPLDAFAAPTKGGGSDNPGRHDKRAVDVQRLPISARMKNLICGIDDPEHQYESRSEQVFAVLIAMAAAGCADGDMEAIFLDDRFPIAAHVLEQAKPDEYLGRQIAKAREKAVDPIVEELNKSYAVTLVGGKVSVMKISLLEDFDLLNVSAFQQWYANRFVGKKTVAQHWLTHAQRRQYEGIVFAPNRTMPSYFNLWRGFAVEPKPGDCSKFLAHVCDNVCKGDESLFRWVIGWFADIVQHPDQKKGTSLALRGIQGTGKTKLGEVFGSLLGSHYTLVSDQRYVTGRFNSHLNSCLLLHCDEAFWAGDHSAEGKLKDLITGDYQFIEMKGKEPIRVRNYLRLLVTGNHDWVVPAGFRERRFAVLDMSEAHAQDHAYFAAIDEEMGNGGREALLHHLLNFDLSSVDVRTIPQTAALAEQKINSMTLEEGWWLSVLSRGSLPFGCDSPDECPAKALFDDYIRHGQAIGRPRRSIETLIGIFLRKHVPGLRKNPEGQYRLFRKQENPNIGATYEFPPLGGCREAFARMVQITGRWSGPEDWVFPDLREDDVADDGPM